MKKVNRFSLFLLLGCLLLILTACPKDEPSQNADNSGSSSSSPAQGQHTHVWQDATCTTPKICSECGVKEGAALGHAFTQGVCSQCGEVDYSTLVHSEGLEFILNDAGTAYAVTGIGTCTDTSIVIPGTYCDLPVTAVGEMAFQNCKQITSVILPDSITVVESYAFVSCSSLTSIVLSDNITLIGPFAFRACALL